MAGSAQHGILLITVCSLFPAGIISLDIHLSKHISSIITLHTVFGRPFQLHYSRDSTSRLIIYHLNELMIMSSVIVALCLIGFITVSVMILMAVHKRDQRREAAKK